MSAAHGQRADIWQRLRAAGSFTSVELVAAGHAKATVLKYLAALRADGYIEVAHQPRGAAVVYRLVKDTGPIAPTVSRNYQVARAHPSAAYRIWQAARVLRRFTTVDLALTAEASPRAARAYVAALRRAGYVREIAPRRFATPGGHAVYQLIKNPGPLPLRGRRAGTTQTLYDPNTKEVFHP